MECKTPEREGARERSDSDDSPLEECSYDSHSPVINWNFSKPKVSKEVKQAAKKLAVTMSALKNRKRAYRRNVKNFNAPTSTTRCDSSLIESPKSCFHLKAFLSTEDFKAIERLDLEETNYCSKRSGDCDYASENSGPKRRCNFDALGHIDLEETNLINSKSEIPSDTSAKTGFIECQSKEKKSADASKIEQDSSDQKSLIDQMLDDDLMLFMSPELLIP